MSTRLDVEIHREGHVWRQRYANSKPVSPLEQMETTSKRGTTVTFWADDTIFETTTYSFETISRRLQEMAFLNKGLTITLRDERADHVVVEDDGIEAGPKSGKAELKEIVYFYAGGIADFVRLLQRSGQWNPAAPEQVPQQANQLRTY